ncbi:MAG TPA: DUF1343 domain-containing protein, partial [Candidatus Ozemobacteraceae bacterium]|nr:DUF1343 domain-containing protein [Candidatus Ozemobacteraceae bacterium]
EACRGIRLDTGSPLLHDAFGIGIMTLSAFMRSHPGRIEFTTRPSLPHPFFDHLAGNSWVREALLAGAPPSEIVARANAEHQAFAAERQSFWLYSGS